MRTRTVAALAGFAAGLVVARAVAASSGSNLTIVVLDAGAESPAPSIPKEDHVSRFHISKRKVLGLVGTIAVFAAVAASASWLSDGSGDAGSQFGAQSGGLTATPASVTQLLLPGQMGAAGLTVSNPTGGALKLTRIGFAGPFTLTSGGPCDLSGLSIVGDGTYDLPTPQTIQPGGSITLEARNIVQAPGDLDNGCQNAAFTFRAAHLFATT